MYCWLFRGQINVCNEYFPNEVCDVALETENSSVWLGGREEGLMSSSLLPGMIWLSPMTQDCNNVKAKWWNAEIKGPRQVHQICLECVPQSLYWHSYSDALHCPVLQRKENMEGDMKHVGDGWMEKNWEGIKELVKNGEWRKYTDRAKGGGVW